MRTRTKDPTPVRVKPAEVPDPEYRSRRVKQLAEAHRRRQVLVAAGPAAPVQLINAIAATDSYWTETETWRAAIGLINPTTPQAADPPTRTSTSPVRITKEQQQSKTSALIPSQADASQAPPKTLAHLRVPFRRAKTISPQRSSTVLEPIADEPEPEPLRVVDGTFDVPAPGGKIRNVGRGRTWTTRLALIVAPLALIGGLAFSCGVSAGSSRVATPAAITAGEAAAYHLSTFPAAAAAAFGVTYVTLCLTHPNPSDDQATADRLTALARMTSAGVPAGCGWDGTGVAQQPLSVTWAGTSSPVAAAYSTGSAAQLTYVVAMPDRHTVTIAVPLWASSLTGQADFQVVGGLSLLPAAAPTTAPTPAAAAAVDPDLAVTLSTTVLLPFLQSWAASDSVQLNLVLAGGASRIAEQGMEGQLRDPQLDTAQVVLDHGTAGKYRDGDQVTAQVTVDWRAATGAGIQTASYAIPLQLTAGKWLVLDITGGPVDSQGGGAANTTYQSTSGAPPATPVPTQ